MKLISTLTTAMVILMSGVAMAHPAETLAKKQVDGHCVTMCTEDRNCPTGYVSDQNVLRLSQLKDTNRSCRTLWEKK